MQNKPNFILCVGCLKGGTTWLHDYLDNRPDTAMSDPKELHVFDSIFLPKSFGGSFRIRQKNFNNATQGMSMEQVYREKTGLKYLRAMAMCMDPSYYAFHFHQLSQKPGVKLVGDVTPDYCYLNENHYKQIQNLLAPHFNLKIVLLMRDPIERIYSFIRMMYRDPDFWKPDQSQNIEQAFANHFNKPRHRLGSQYESMIGALEEVFKPEELFYGFYETLFQEEEVKKLTSFLGLEYQAPDFDKKVNATQKEGSLPEELTKAARKELAKTYDFCSERFGKEFIDEIWQNA